MITYIDGPLKRERQGKLTLTIDIDGTTIAILPRVIELHQESGGIPTNFSNITNYNVTQFLRNKDGTPISIERLRELVRMAYSEPKKLRLVHRNTRAIINGAFAQFNIRFITATWAQPDILLNTLDHFRLCYDGLAIASTEDEKISTAGDLHLDDRWETSVAVAQSGRYAFQLTSPYNWPVPKKLIGRMYRVKDWPHFGRMVLSGVYKDGQEDLPEYIGTELTL